MFGEKGGEQRMETPESRRLELITEHLKGVASELAGMKTPDLQHLKASLDQTLTPNEASELRGLAIILQSLSNEG